ncbi:unnamed protein product, partial [Trichogramma brassicae]
MINAYNESLSSAASFGSAAGGVGVLRALGCWSAGRWLCCLGWSARVTSAGGRG